MADEEGKVASQAGTDAQLIPYWALLNREAPCYWPGLPSSLVLRLLGAKGSNKGTPIITFATYDPYHSSRLGIVCTASSK